MRQPGFRITARTLFHLGADLISTDAMALYELVKNAFDAGSERVAIQITTRVPVAVANPLLDRIAAALEIDESDTDFVKNRVLVTLDGCTDDDFVRRVRTSTTLQELFEAYLPVNQIVVSDTGHGMCLSELRDVFLTVGTMSRRAVLEDRRRSGVAAGTRPVLGEKGVGRLSSMRLGGRLLVESAKRDDSKWNILDLDWSTFSRRPEALLEDIRIAPYVGGPKTRHNGTSLYIRQLSSDWTIDKLTEIARDEFSRLNDPFEGKSRFPIDLSFNDASVPVPAFRSLILDEAHATVTASFGPLGPDGLLPNGAIRSGADLQVRGEVDYRLRHRKLPIELSGIHLRSAAGADRETLRSVGPFDLKVYWFNRAILEEVDTIGDKRAVQKLVNQWSGGVMVYRDGFRVGGYGSGADDWLGLDRKALASGGYKVNRAQLIGRLVISSIANPMLIDQTNREGLRDSREKDALIALLKFILENVFRPFLNKVDDEIQAREPVDVKKLAERVLAQRRTIAQTLRLLYERFPQVKADPLLGGRIEEALTDIGEIMRNLQEMEASYIRGRSELTVLAGIGLSVAAIAHDLRQITNNALGLVDRLRSRRTRTDLTNALAPLGAQLKTLLTRLRVLDPLVTSGRQVKKKIKLLEWVPNIVETIAPAFEGDLIALRVVLLPLVNGDGFEVNVVPGMVVQVVSNLLDNARYWVKRTKLEHPGFAPLVLVEVDEARREMRISDNGPGVEEAMRTTVFDAFVTTKPPGAGVGLGLFIAKEIAKYSDANLRLLSNTDTPAGMSTTFALQFGKKTK